MGQTNMEKEIVFIIGGKSTSLFFSPVDMEVQNASNIEIAHTYAAFGILGSLERGFSAELK